MRAVRRTRRGFSFIELMVTLVVIGIMASFATMRYIDMTHEGFAAKAGSEVRAIRLAAFNYFADRQTWPPGAGAGTMPADLAPYLPTGLRFQTEQYSLEFFNSAPADPDNATVTINIRADSERVLNKLRQRLATPGSPFTFVGGTLSLIITAPGARG